jgi:hypothetical protein
MLIASLLTSEDFAKSADGQTILGQLAFIAGAKNVKGSFPSLLRTLSLHTLPKGNSLLSTVLSNLGNGMKLNGQYLPTTSPQSMDRAEKWFASVMQEAKETATAENSAEADRITVRYSRQSHRLAATGRRAARSGVGARGLFRY